MTLQNIEIVSARPDALPVVRAWIGLGREHRTPDRVEILSWKPKSIVFRLEGVGSGGADVIAKGCPRDTGGVERDIYARVLSCVLPDRVGYRGFADDRDDALCWLFLEDTGGEAFEPQKAEHREVATRWLAHLHTRSSSVAAAAELPDRGPGHYREHLRSARLAIRQNRDNPALLPADHEVLDRMLAQFDFVEAGWDKIESACRQLPRSLVHGDFDYRNVRVRRGPDGLGLVVFDWEMAGWGLPGVDLARADLHLYGSLVRDVWSGMDLETLERMAGLGRLLRGGLAASNWAVPDLATEWVEKPINRLSIYHERIQEDLKALGWIA